MARNLPPALQRWIDHNRHLVLMLIVLPLSFLSRTIRSFRRRWTRSNREGHRNRVARVALDVRRARDTAVAAGRLAALRTDRSGNASLNTRSAVKAAAASIKLQDLNAVLGVRLGIGRAFVRIEPYATVGEVTDYLENEGYQLENTIEMREASLGGLVMALGMTSHSHEAGLVADTVLAYDIVTANGDLVRATRDNDHSDLFRALPSSHGTLGFLVAMELKIIPLPSLLRVTYRPMYSLEECHAELEHIVTRADPPYFLEAFVFSRETAVIVEGKFASWRENMDGRIPTNTIGWWHKPWFYKHAETMLVKLGPGMSTEEMIPTERYLLRHDRSMCMTMGQILPQGNHPLYRYLAGWMLPPDRAFLKRSRSPAEREYSIRKSVYQDFCAPASKFPSLIEWLDVNFNIYPLLVYPCRIMDKGGMVRLRQNKGKPIPTGREEKSLYMDVGIFGVPKAIRNGSTTFPTVTKVRELVAMVRDWGGFVHTYCDVTATEAEFQAMFDHTLWRKMRVQYGANGVFPTIYEKVSPRDINIAAYLREEASWQQQ
jgi:Delta24-sterol reductase